MIDAYIKEVKTDNLIGLSCMESIVNTVEHISPNMGPMERYFLNDLIIKAYSLIIEPSDKDFSNEFKSIMNILNNIK